MSVAAGPLTHPVTVEGVGGAGLPPPQKSDKTLYTGIYLPTFREGTNFIIKTVSFVSGGPYGPGGVLSDFEGGRGGVPKVYNRRDPEILDLESRSDDKSLISPLRGS